MVSALISSFAVLLVNFRKGVGMMTVAIFYFLMINNKVHTSDFLLQTSLCQQMIILFFKLHIIIQPPRTEGAGLLIIHRNNDVRKKRLRGYAIMLRRHSRMIGMRVIYT